MISPSDLSATYREQATKLVNEAIKDHDDGGYAYISINEILITKITQALEQSIRTPIKWPDLDAIHSKMKEWSPDGYDSRTFYETVEWLKSFVEKGE